MSKIGVVTDSHSGITPEEAGERGIFVVPAPFYIDGKLYHEGIDLNRSDFFRMQLAGADIKTSQPSVTELMGIWDAALKDHEAILYIPISSGLSGSWNTAQLLSQEEKYDGRVYVVDNGRVSVPQYCTILDALNLINAGLSPFEIKLILEKNKANEVIYVAIDDISHLKKGGRISSASAIAASLLKIKPVVQFDVGTIDIYKNCRGMNKAKKEMFSALKNDLGTRFSSWYEKGDFYLMTATAVEEDEDQAFIREVKEYFPGIKIYSGLLALATCGHIGYGGLGVGVSCMPRVEGLSPE